MTEKTVAERLEFVKGFKYLGAQPIVNKDGKPNRNKRNFLTLSFMDAAKQSRGIEIRKEELAEFEAAIEVQG